MSLHAALAVAGGIRIPQRTRPRSAFSGGAIGGLGFFVLFSREGGGINVSARYSRHGDRSGPAHTTRVATVQTYNWGLCGLSALRGQTFVLFSGCSASTRYLPSFLLCQG